VAAGRDASRRFVPLFDMTGQYRAFCAAVLALNSMLFLAVIVLLWDNSVIRHKLLGINQNLQPKSNLTARKNFR
jgi:hypothetical protein